MQNLEEERNNIICEINSVLENANNTFNSIGLTEGLTGLSLFNYYLYLDSQCEMLIDRVFCCLDFVLECLSSEKHLVNSTSMDIIEIGKYLYYLNCENIIDNKTLKSNLIEINPLLKKKAKDEIQKHDKCSVFDIITVGHFLLDSIEIINQKEILFSIVALIEKNGILSKNAIYWESDFRGGNKTIESGFFHGIAGIVFFLAVVYNKGFLKKKCLELIDKSIYYLNEFRSINEVNIYPIDLKTGSKIPYHNLAYGDIGIAYSLYKTGILIENNYYKEMGVEIFENAANFKDDDSIHIKDAELIYGSSGLFALYDDLHRDTSKAIFKEASTYWFEKTLKYNKNDSPWAGYKTYINGFDDNIQLSFAHGICGIGIALINHRMKGDNSKYLSFLNYK